MHKTRIEKLLKICPKDSAFYITDPEDMLYYASFSGEGGVLISEDKKLVITDGRYTEIAQKQCTGFEVLSISDLYDILKSLNCEILVQGAHISYNSFSKLKKEVGSVSSSDVNFDALRSVKDEDEILNLKKAAAIAEDVWSEVLQFIRPGKTERETAAFIDYSLKLKGADGNSFDTICVSGANTSLPHGVPTDKKFENGDFITFDFGCKVNGYCSDMTRTVALGFVTDEMAKVYDTVLNAQTMASDAVKAGVNCKDIDKVARDFISSNGYGEYFSHSLGHGVGLKIHEQPNLSSKSEGILEIGNIVTVEPGIYIPGKFGVRIENTMIVREDFGENLQKSSKELIIL